MDIKKCETCKWLVLMSFCDGKTVDPSRQMCHYNWKECKAVRKDECHYKAKREHHNEEE